ncbi:hypothetical protein SAMN02745673_03999 [Marinactinospora thermotolerans DSM 45154]|uniref:Uncharacterized protein n=1 Tax=Marinactinospora thermotolerans DSM 45154 TaxID=1122192 RepID=A0A1T4STN5_9ACTN|nr:hypothetical protein SAMN02745673_03999 [Marinactinospora thermotolerans DSM 45154]
MGRPERDARGILTLVWSPFEQEFLPGCLLAHTYRVLWDLSRAWNSRICRIWA